MNLSKGRDFTKAREALKLHKHKHRERNIFEWQEQKTNIHFKMHHYAFLGMRGESEGELLLGPPSFPPSAPWLGQSHKLHLLLT